MSAFYIETHVAISIFLAKKTKTHQLYGTHLKYIKNTAWTTDFVFIFPL